MFLRPALEGRHERPFRLPGGHVIPFLAFFSSNMIVYWAGWETNWKLFVAILIGAALLAGYKLVVRDTLPPMEWRAGAWVVPWLVALALISYLGSYGVGARDLFGLGVGAALVLVVSAAVYYAGYALALPTDRVNELVRSTPPSAARS